jgi:signal transduction histidine kinase
MVMAARDGEMGLQLARQNQPDLILLDVMLPGIDGFEVCRRLKADEQTREIPILFMTVMTSVEDKVKGFEVGGVDYITKPFQYEEILARVITHLRLRELSGRLEQKVRERTEELTRANQQLQQEMAERERAEEELKKHQEHLEELVNERTAELATAKEQAETAQSAAEAANRAKSAFLANMSHELRTPLNAILGYAQILQRRPLEADIIENLNIVQQSGEHLLTLITDILDFSKIETGRMELHPAPFRFSSFLDNIAGITRTRAEAKNLTFIFEAMEGTLPTWVEADETRLRQVLLNLLDNAVKFTEVGQVTLRVAGRQQQSEQGSQGTDEQGGDFSPAPRPPGPPAHPPRLSSTVCCLHFEVQDTGIGISSDQLERIFQPFEQVGDVLHYTEGTGLGLAISRQLVRLMGGELHVESTPFTSFLRSPLAATEGRIEGPPGSLFWFEVALPATEAAVEAERPLERIITGYKGPRCTVLMVDDVPSNRAVVVDLLKPLGFEVFEAVDGRQAIHLARELRPDLILLDRWMPGLDGFEAARQMRQIPELTGTSIIAVSASVSKEDQAQSREAGIDAFLPKPVNWPELAALLEEHLELEWAYGKEQGSSPYRRLRTGAREQGGTFPSAPPPLRPPAPLVPPPQEEMAILHDLALRGDMRGIRERAAHIETLGEQYAPFAKKLHGLARAFEERELLALVKQYVGNK